MIILELQTNILLKHEFLIFTTYLIKIKNVNTNSIIFVKFSVKDMRRSVIYNVTKKEGKRDLRYRLEGERLRGLHGSRMAAMAHLCSPTLNPYSL